MKGNLCIIDGRAIYCTHSQWIIGACINNLFLSILEDNSFNIENDKCDFERNCLKFDCPCNTDDGKEFTEEEMSRIKYNLSELTYRLLKKDDGTLDRRMIRKLENNWHLRVFDWED